MNGKNTTDRYGTLSVAMHWLMLLLLIGVYAFINLADVFPPIGTIGYWLIGLHAAAALFHHYVTRDNTLARMSPWRA